MSGYERYGGPTKDVRTSSSSTEAFTISYLLVSAAAITAVILSAYNNSIIRGPVFENHQGVYGNQYTAGSFTLNSRGEIIDASNVPIDTECVNIEQYGAIANDSMDDSVAIQEAIDTESCVYIPPGTFDTNTTLTIQKNGFTMYGSGVLSIISSTASPILDISGATNCDVSRFTLSTSTSTIGLSATTSVTQYNNIHDITITGSMTGLSVDSGITNNQFDSMIYNQNNVSVSQSGTTTTKNIYSNSHFTDFTGNGFQCIEGSVIANDNTFNGATTAFRDVFIEATCAEVTLTQNYHDIDFARTNIRVYDFPDTTRTAQSTIRETTIISNLTASDYLVYYFQSGPLTIRDMTWDTGAGTVYLDNQKATQPGSELGFVTGAPTTPKIVKGNWNYQAFSNLATRSYFAIQALADVDTPQAIFQDPYDLADYTTYEINGVVTVERTAGTNAHQIQFTQGGTATVIIAKISFIVAPTLSLATPVMTTGVLISFPVAITASNSDAVERITIRLSGQIRTGVTGAGTWIPQLQWTAAPGGVPSIATSSYMTVLPIGNIGVVDVNKKKDQQ